MKSWNSCDDLVQHIVDHTQIATPFRLELSSDSDPILMALRASSIETSSDGRPKRLIMSSIGAGSLPWADVCRGLNKYRHSLQCMTLIYSICIQIAGEFKVSQNFGCLCIGIVLRVNNCTIYYTLHKPQVVPTTH